MVILSPSLFLTSGFSVVESTSDANLLVMPAFSVTVKSVRALIAGIPIVRPDFILCFPHLKVADELPIAR